MADTNKLANMATAAQKHEAIQQSAVASWMTLSRTAPQQASVFFDSDPIHFKITMEFAELVTQRLNGPGQHPQRLTFTRLVRNDQGNLAFD